MKPNIKIGLLTAFGLTIPIAFTQAAEIEGPREETGFFNGEDLTGWQADDMSFWSVKDGAIVGTAGEKEIPGNQFLWHETPVKNFYLSLKVKQAPYSTNAGIQFRSTKNDKGAFGYQADVGKGWWGTLYHEHGRRILARSADTTEENIKSEDWNHYEILAVGHRIWLAINGKITVALRDKLGETEGRIAVQIHKGAPQEVAYKEFKLIHNPKVELLGMGETALNALLKNAPVKRPAGTRKGKSKKKTANASLQNKPPRASSTPETRQLSPKEARELLRDDWLYQAGETLDLKDIRNEIRWARQIAERYNGQTADGIQRHMDRLSGSEEKFRTFSATTPAGDIQDLYTSIREIKRQILFADPALDFDSILFIDNEFPIAGMQPENQDKKDSLFFNCEWNHQAQHRNGFMAVPGGRLLLLKGLDPGNEIRELAPSEDLGPGSFLRPDVSFDGKKVLFSFKPATDHSFHLYEMDIDGSDLKQLTDGVYDDEDPIYLPDGHIMFTTTRGHTTVRCMRYSRSTLLARCDADGGNVYILSRNNEPDWLPSLLSDGRVAYTRWEYTEKNVMRIQGLWSVFPDGTKPEVLWGNMSVWPDHLASPRQIPGTSQIMFAGVGHHHWHSGSIGIVDPSKGREYPDGLIKVTQDLEFAEVGDGPDKLAVASKNYHASGQWGSYKNPYPLSRNLFLVSIYKGTLPANGKRMGWPGYFQLYLMDTDGNRELIYKGTHNIFHAMPVKPRERPVERPSTVKWPGTGKDRQPNAPGYFFSNNVYAGTTIPKGAARHLRVIQLDYKTHTPWRQDFFGGGPDRIPLVSGTYDSASSKRVLGTVPIGSEGGFYFEAPSGTQLMLQLLDENYRCMQTMRSFTGVMPGETRGCVGCHEQRPTTPVSMAGLRGSPSKITPPPWGTISFNYERMIQPIFDEHCMECHGDSSHEATRKLDLRMVKKPPKEKWTWEDDFSDVYLTLIGSGRYGPTGQDLKNYTGAIDISMDRRSWKQQEYSLPFEPMTFFSYNSPLLDVITTDKKHHGDLKLKPNELRMLAAWMDLNSPYRGDDDLRQLPDPQFEGIENIVPRPQIKSSPIVVRP